MKIDFIRDAETEQVHPLLTPRAKAKLIDAESLFRRKAETSAAMPERQADFEDGAEFSAAEVANDHLLRTIHADRIETAIFEFREPTVADADAIASASTPETEGAVPQRRAGDLARERLSPSIVSGWSGDLPLAITLTLEAELLSRVFVDLSEDRRLFTIRSQAARNSKEASA